MENLFGCSAQRLDRYMSSAEVTQLYHQSAAEGRQNNYTPVVVFVDDTLEETIEMAIEDAESAEEYAKSVLSNDHTNGKALLSERYAELESSYGSELNLDNESLDKWFSVPSNDDDLTFLPDISRHGGEAYLVKVPTKNPYEIFAWIPFGGWNDCPDTDEMIAVCKHWYENYGAVPAMITHDTLTFYLERPVDSKETTVNLAKEQCAFCSEVIGMGGIGSYAAMTYNGCSWNFWWD